MIDLKKIQEKFDNLFEKENEDSFNEWLFEKKKKEALALLSNNNLFECRNVVPEGVAWVQLPPAFSKKPETQVPDNTKYAMAA